MLTELEKFEIVAEAFRLMTGMMAPGKDAGMFAYQGADYETERRNLFDAWSKANSELVQAMFAAFDRIVGVTPDDGED